MYFFLLFWEQKNFFFFSPPNYLYFFSTIGNKASSLTCADDSNQCQQDKITCKNDLGNCEENRAIAAIDVDYWYTEATGCLVEKTTVVNAHNTCKDNLANANAQIKTLTIDLQTSQANKTDLPGKKCNSFCGTQQFMATIQHVRN